MFLSKSFPHISVIMVKRKFTMGTRERTKSCHVCVVDKGEGREIDRVLIATRDCGFCGHHQNDAYFLMLTTCVVIHGHFPKRTEEK